MRLMDLLRETLSALNANRGRSLLTVLGIIIGIGLIFGYWPARRASKLNPVESPISIAVSVYRFEMFKPF